MKSNSISSLKQILAIGAFTFGTIVMSSHAGIVGPYTQDAQTLHLWHFDTATPVLDSVSTSPVNLNALVNGATLGNAGYTGFGNALDTAEAGWTVTPTVATNKDAILTAAGLSGGGAATNISFTYMNPTTHAFTYEAVVRIDWDPSANLGTVALGGNGRNGQCIIVNCEGSAASGRIFQFRIDPINTQAGNTQPLLEFVNVHNASPVQSIAAPIPTTGPDAIVQGNWYHVAVAYNGSPGTADNMKFYWTLMDTNRVAANQILSTTMNQDLSTGSTILGFGNISRTPTVNFLGRIDEVRMSSVARSAGDMMFTSPEVSIVSEPTSQTVAIGQNASFSVGAAGQGLCFTNGVMEGKTSPEQPKVFILSSPRSLPI